MNYLLYEEMQEAIEDAYQTIMLLYYRLWEKMLMLQDNLKEGEKMKTVLYELQEAEIDGEKVYRGIIYTLLPRARNFELNNQIRRTWLYTSIRLFSKIQKKYDSVYLKFVIYLPAGNWDVDNRPLKYIIDGIRHCGLIPDDSYKHVMYSVHGETDNKNPRVEIYIFDGKKEREHNLSIREKFPNIKTPEEIQHEIDDKKMEELETEEA